MSDRPSITGHVLVSVGHEAFLGQLCDFLRGLGCVVAEAPSLAEGLDLLAEPSFEAHLLLTDAPPTLARRAVECRPGLKVLVISSEPEYVNRALVPESEIAFIEKPFAWCDLRRTIETLLPLRRGPRQCGLDPLAVAAG